MKAVLTRLTRFARPAWPARALERLGIVGRARDHGAGAAVGARSRRANVVRHLAVDTRESLGALAHVLVGSGTLAGAAVLARLVSAAVV